METASPTGEIGLRVAGVASLASRRRRFASLGYEAFLLVAVLVVAGFILVPISQVFAPGARRIALQVSLTGVAGLYCVLCWLKGQTLAMKAWGIALRQENGSVLDRQTAIRRFLWALPGTLLAGAGFVWSFFDRDRQFLHDRLAGTRLIDVSRSAALEPQDHEHARGQEQ